jgi:hypothetical protein
LSFADKKVGIGKVAKVLFLIVYILQEKVIVLFVRELSECNTIEMPL